MRTSIYWFRKDLRLEDNSNLNKAIRESDALLPVFIMEDRWSEQNPIGIPRMGDHRRAFLLESLHELRSALKGYGLPLIYREGDAVTVLSGLMEETKASAIYCSKEVGTEEKAQEEALDSQFDLRTDWSQFLVHPRDLPFPLERLHHVFTRFRKAIEGKVEIRKVESLTAIDIEAVDIDPGDIPRISPAVSPDAAFRLSGGARAGQDRIGHYLWETDDIARYKKTRNGMLGESFSGKFSAHLAWGCISPVQIQAEVLRYESERTKNESTYWMIFELLWRDFFKYVGMKHGALLFQLRGIRDSQLQYHKHQGLFQKWIEGRTGDDFVDANMIELKETGWMSNRGRQNVASYLCHDYQVDWRWGAWWLEHCLVDYDVTSNWGNWMYLAGVGNDPRSRKFNTQKQADMYDPDRVYRQLWLRQ
jgi:deoxyribodipyrimidine photo-lyase